MKIKFNKLNNFGVAHDVMMIAVVAIVAIAGVGYLVASHADTLTPQCYPDSLSKCSKLGSQVDASANNTVTVYACKYSSGTNDWTVSAYFTLANTYKQPSGYYWDTYMINSTTDPLKGVPLITDGVFNDNYPTPYSYSTTEVYNQADNYMTFQYTTNLNGASTSSGILASKIRPGNLPTCPTS